MASGEGDVESDLVWMDEGSEIVVFCSTVDY